MEEQLEPAPAVWGARWKPSDLQQGCSSICLLECIRAVSTPGDGRDLFGAGMSTGAPPDSFFALGQDWNFPPLHPERIREQGHQYFARSIRHHMRHARYLRVDHVMSLHRLFWVPEAMDPKDGVYVTYPAEESYAVLALESHRNRTVVVGEDLGTVAGGSASEHEAAWGAGHLGDAKLAAVPGATGGRRRAPPRGDQPQHS